MRFRVFALNTVLIVLGYVLWIFTSYLLVPFAPPEYDVRVPAWPREGYITFRPGTYHNPKHGVTYQINAAGLRGPLPPVISGRLRILCLGESSTMGLESAESETWPARLQAQVGARTDVLNAGVSGSSSREHRALLRDLWTWKPDVILYYAGYNDYALVALERYPGPARWPAGRLNFLRHWALFKRVQVRAVLWPLVDLDAWMPWSNQWATAYRTNLEALRADAATHGARLIGVSQLVRGDRWDIRWRATEAEAIQRETFLEWWNIRTAIPDTAGLWYDVVHLTPDGNAAVATAVAALLLPRPDPISAPRDVVN